MSESGFLELLVAIMALTVVTSYAVSLWVQLWFNRGVLQQLPGFGATMSVGDRGLPGGYGGLFALLFVLTLSVGTLIIFFEGLLMY